MGTSLGRITAKLAEPLKTIPDNLIELINENIKPPVPVGKDDVIIRAMYIVSDQINSFGGCFPVDEHEQLASLIIDSPVLVGHRKDTLPVARNFHATLIEKDSEHWIKCYFYWLKSVEGAEYLRENIDGGIYKEGSIGFTFHFPECSICGKDIRTCEHEPFEKYNLNGTEEICHYNYRQIEKVLETSLVYRGATPGTEFSRELQILKDKNISLSPDKVPGELNAIDNLNSLDPTKDYLLLPAYEKIPVTVTLSAEQISLVMPEKSETTLDLNDKFDWSRLTTFATKKQCPAYLLGYRGKKRCSVEDLRKFLKGQKSPVSRVTLKLWPDPEITVKPSVSVKHAFEIESLPFRLVSSKNIAEAIGEITTRSGVEIWPIENQQIGPVGYLYKPDEKTLSLDKYALHLGQNNTAYLQVGNNQQNELHLKINQFNLTRLQQGGRFIADVAENAVDLNSVSTRQTQSGIIVHRQIQGDAWLLSLKGILEGEFVVCPALLNGRRRFLFYRLKDKSCKENGTGQCPKKIGEEI